MSGERDLPFDVPRHPAGLRIVLVGKTGSGKSAAGNTILGKDCYESRLSAESVTEECQIGQVMLEGKTISVTDTPGVYDTNVPIENVRRELNKCIYMTVPGPHVFLLLIRVGVRFSRDEKDTVQWIFDNFGMEALQYTMVLFTHTDELKDKTLDQYVDESSKLKKLIRDCGGRFHGFNNTDTNRSQVTGLLQKVNGMVGRNRGVGREYYTNDMFKRAQEQVEAEIRKQKAIDDMLKKIFDEENKKQKAIDKKRKRENMSIAAAVGVGAAAAVAGGVVLGVTALISLPAVLIGLGAAAVLRGGFALFKRM